LELFLQLSMQKKKKSKHIACATQGSSREKKKGNEPAKMAKKKAKNKGNEPAKRARRLGEKKALVSCNLCNSREVM
jgi:hypothetical protein